jgi:hypothetical protein
MRYMTVILVTQSCARVVFRGSLLECQRVAESHLLETFIIPTHY